MGDPISVVANITAVLQLGRSAVTYLNDVKEASTACNRILVEISITNGLLSSLESLIGDPESSDTWLETTKLLSSENSPLALFKISIERLAARLMPVVGMKRAGKAFVWPFVKSELTDILTVIERQKTLLLLAIQNDHLTLSQAIRHDIAVLQDGVRQLQVDRQYQEDRDLLTWLSPLKFYSKQNDIFSRRLEGTGKWLLEADLFRAWVYGTEEILWCPGIPGAGKTILASVIIDYLEHTFNEKIAVAYLYCNYKERNQTAVNFVASLLQQLIQKLPTIPTDIISIYKYYTRRQTRPTLAKLSGLLQSQVQQFSKVYIIVDALDEYLQGYGINDFLPEIRKLLPNIHLLVTSRFVPDIEREFAKASCLKIRAHDRDVKDYIEGRIAGEPQMLRHTKMDPTLQNTILDTIIQKANGMFLLAQLHMDSLIMEDNCRDVYRTLQNMPKQLDETYDEAMKRIQSQDCRKVKRAVQVLSWISYAVRPLTMKEIQYALAVEPGDANMVEEALPYESLLISACAGLVVVDHESDVVRLVHYTTQEYFERTRLHHFPAAQDQIAMACLTYLSFDIFAGGCCLSDQETEARLKENPLLHYAAQNWGHHVRGDAEQSQIIQEMVQDFLRQEPKVSCSVQVQYIPRCQFEGYTLQFPRDVSGLQVAASFGLKEIVKVLIEKGADITAEDSDGATPLHGAALNGYEEVVGILLDDGAEIEARNKDGMTALHWAASNGCETVVRMLLERRADTGVKSNLGETVLHQAAYSGHKAVVQQLLDAKVELDVKNTEYGDTPLTLAACKAHETIVRLLLEHGADPDITITEYGSTSLCIAAEEGYDTIARLLLSQKSIKPDHKDRYGRTPLYWAAQRGHPTVVRLLLERNDVDPNSTDRWGRTPLLKAKEYGHGSVVKLLTPFASGRPVSDTLLSLLQAAENGDEALVRRHLEQDRVNPDIRSSNGETPLQLAARNGHDVIVQLLLEQDGVDPDSKCISCRTPLSWAAENGHKNVVKLLLNKGVDLNSKSISGRSALWLAAFKDQKEVVQLLLDYDSIDVDSLCPEFNSTPLTMAVERGHEEIVRMLLAKGANFEARDIDGRTMLRIAEFNRREAIVQMLKSKIQSAQSRRDSRSLEHRHGKVHVG